MRQLNSIFILILLLSFSKLLRAQKDYQEFKLFGQIFHKETTIKDVSIKVSLNDSIIYSDESNFNGKFKLKLVTNKSYRIDFSKDKYITKTVIVNIYSQDSTEIKPFAFDIELVQQRDFRYVEVPGNLGEVAHLYYDEEKEALSWDKQYTQEAHETIKNLQELNKAKRYEKYSRF